MSQPVQPPEIPAIIQTVTSEKAANLDQFSNGTQVSAQTQTLLTEVLATPTPPRIFTPESLSLTAEKSAALLGPPISIGYSLQPAPRPGPSGLVAQEDSPRVEKQKIVHFLLSAPVTSSYQLRSLSFPTPSSSKAVASEKLLSLKNDELKAMSDKLEKNFFTHNSDAPYLTTGSVQRHSESRITNTAASLTQKAKSSGSAPNGKTLAQSLITPNSYEVMPNVKRLVTHERGGQVREFKFSVPRPEAQALAPEKVAPRPDNSETAPQPSISQGSPTTVPTSPLGVGGVIELTADRQEYNDQQKVITAQGNVVLRFREALLNADRVSVNLPNRVIVAEGNVALTRGDQVLRGERFEYYFVQDSGVVLKARGELYTPTTGTDLSIFPPPDGSVATAPPRPVSDRIRSNQPLQGVSNPGGYSFVLGAGRTIQNLPGPQSGGTINRLRYEADRIDFDGKGAIATNIRIANDPFSPPELELRADTARFTRLEPLVDEIVASRPRLVFDQGLEVPTFRNRIRIDRRQREPALINFGYDGSDRGGLFAYRTFYVIDTPAVQFSVRPEYYIQRGIFEDGIIGPSTFGFQTRLNAILGPRTTVTGRTVLTTLDPNEIEDDLRASLRLQQIIGTSLPHTLNVEYSYRDRLYNGSLGFQTVQSSLGAVLTSPVIPLGQTGINLTYQVGAQYINADTDREDLLEPDRINDRISLGRYEAIASLSKGFLLWQGQALPPTPTEGLRYTPAPVVPYLQFNTGITGVASAYTSGDTQESLSGSIGLEGQFGHFSKPFLDYTGFNISYTQVALGNVSPFLFDRVVDTSILSGGITQQIYGPFRAGFQTSISLDNQQDISTDYFVEYSRRTYNILLRYNPVLQIGSINLRINDFNWTGNPGLFDNSEIRPVRQGVPQ